MSLRATILQYSLPLLPKHSFTRRTLSAALQSARLEGKEATPFTAQIPLHRSNDQSPDSDAIGQENIIDTLFGTGTTSPARALLASWQDAGLQALEKIEYRQGDLSGRLEERLEFSARVGEHLVEAYALMSSPSSAPSLPLPPFGRSILNQISSYRLPPLYRSPASPRQVSENAAHRDQDEAGASSELSTSNLLDRLDSATGGRLPLLRINPFGALGYAWDIADRALAVDERQEEVKNGLMNEPTGSGPEWYTSRTALGLAYLAAESHLLQPIDSPSEGNPHLEAAKSTLRSHLNQYDGLRASVASSESGTKDVMSMLEFFGRGAVGLLRSRGL